MYKQEQVSEAGSGNELTIVDLKGKEASKVISMFTRLNVSDSQWVNGK